VVEVVRLHVGDDRGEGRQQQERRVALVGLGHEQVAGAVVRVGAGLVEVAADRERRVDAAVLQRHGEHRRRRGLAVRAGDRDAAPAGHHAGQRCRAREHGDAAALRLDDLRVARPDRRRGDDGVDVADVGGVVADVHDPAQRGQRGERPGVLGVAAGDEDAAGEQDARDAAHAGAAYADEVDAPGARRQRGSC
jgi:hypothetical protein